MLEMPTENYYDQGSKYSCLIVDFLIFNIKFLEIT